GEEYITLLENGDTDWYTQLLLACACYENRQYDQAKAAFLASWNDAPNPIAARSLGWMNTADGNTEEARAWMEKAVPMIGDYARLLIDLIHFYKRCGSDEEICALIDNASDTCKANGRVQMYYAESLVKLDRLKEARALVTKDLTVADMKEGEVSTFNLWCSLYRKIIARDENRRAEEIEAWEILDKYPIPAEIDFRMSYVPIPNSKSEVRNQI
ncbi:MAG: tetratricopeptide repeat protein, partial [Clostridia bacterium]|nr:tetratricopeptide repeat protein [Clostridia bacterium]